MQKLNSHNKPLVSIICVCYNQVHFIEKTINGFLSQKTTFPFEIIISDDASTDGSSKLIQNYYNSNQNIIVPILRTVNIGGHQNLINCFKSVNSKYIAYCEGDDYWIDEYKLQKQFDLLELNPEAGLIWTDIDINDLQDNRYSKSVFKSGLFPKFNTFEQILINKPFFAPPTWFFRTQYSNLFYSYADYVDGTFPFIMDLIHRTKIIYHDESTAVYTKRKESTSNNINPSIRYQFAKNIFKIQNDYAIKYNVSDDVIESISINHYKSLLHYAIIADDIYFLKAAYEKLKNLKELHIIILLRISHSNFLRKIFRKVFNNDKSLNLLKNILKIMYK